MTKRLEIYSGWKCNNKCIFCIEYPNIKKGWNNIISDSQMFKNIIKAKNEGYDHITFLGGEPFLHNAFYSGIKIAKIFGLTTLVTTNGSILQYNLKALKYIDELIISIHSINKIKQKKISGSKSFIDYEKVIYNINNNWNGNLLKVNIVVNKLNIKELKYIIIFLLKNNINNISVTYPDILLDYYGIEYTKNYIAPKYSEIIDDIEAIIYKCIKKKINLKLNDFPICVLKNKNIYQLSDDFYYDNRFKITIDNKLINRKNISPRNRTHISKCIKCLYKKICWGPSKYYNKLYGVNEINPILH